MKTIVTLSTLLMLSVLANGLFFETQNKRNAALEQCAMQQNVYRCTWVAKPVEPPRVVMVKPELLPPPELN